MPGRSPALMALLIAGGLAGCGATSNSASRFQGDRAKVAGTIDALTNAATSHDTTRICTKILAPEVSARLNLPGSSCTSAVGKQLDTVDTFTVSVTGVTVNGNTAQARVTSTSNGKNKTDTLNLVRGTDGTWRITSLG